MEIGGIRENGEFRPAAAGGGLQLGLCLDVDCLLLLGLQAAAEQAAEPGEHTRRYHPKCDGAIEVTVPIKPSATGALHGDTRPWGTGGDRVRLRCCRRLTLGLSGSRRRDWPPGRWPGGS